MPVVARPSKLSDAAAVDALSQALYGGRPEVSRLVETALLCLTAVDSDTGSIVGFLCIDDSASARLGSKSNEVWLQSVTSSSHPFDPNTAAFVWAAACSSEYELDASGALLKAAFLTMAPLQTLLLATDSDITFTEPGLASSFTRLAHDRDSGSYLYSTSRPVVLPPLTIRRALVEDHDDLVPVLEASGKRYPALAKLPDTCRPQEAFALSRMVAGQDEQNCVLVAMSGKKLVGFLVTTSEVNTGFLLDCFDLHPFDNFLPEGTYDFQYTTAKNSVHEKKMDQLREQLGRSRSQVPDTGSETGEGEGQAAPAEGGGEDAEPDFDLQAAAVPSDEEVRQEMRAMYECDDEDVETTLVAITMFCILEEYETQALEFMQHAFDAFPDKDYCVVTLPHSSEEPALMATMTRLAPLPGASCPEVLYLFNKNALLKGFEVRTAGSGDSEGVGMLVSGMPNSDDIAEAFKKAQADGLAVVACCQGEVVGLLTICNAVDLAMLQANYCLASLVAMEHHAPDKHAEIDILCMNPIFAHKHRELLAGAQRLLRRTCLYYALPPGQAPPDMLEVLQQVPPLHRPAPNVTQAQFALYMFTRRTAFLRKRAVNAQVVVVGASECGLAAVERLLLDTQLSFNCVTLLAPGGISAGGPACEYTAGLIARLGLEARVALLDAELIGLGVQAKVAELSDGSQLPYDLLLVTSGLQEQTRTSLGQADPEVVGIVVNAMELSADFSLADAIKMDSIVVYGGSLDAYHALNVLDKNEAAPKTTFIAPAGQRSPLVDVLHECADLVGRKELQLGLPQAMTLKSMAIKEGSAKPRALFEGPAAPEGQERTLDLLVACQKPDVSPWVFACLNDAGIVYDGRIVVDGAFRTSDPNIYASGTAAKLSRRYGQDVLFEHYNSKECGQKLGESVVSYFLGTQAPDQVPSLSAARLVGCEVPGGMTFMMAASPRCMMQPSLEPPQGGERLQSITPSGLMTIVFDAAQRVICVAYLGRKEIQGSKLTSLVGLHASYLHDLISKHQDNQVPDLVLFVSEAWSELLHHEGFGDLRAQIKASLIHRSGAGAGVKELEEATRSLVLDFVKAHQCQLPVFTLPV